MNWISNVKIEFLNVNLAYMKKWGKRSNELLIIVHFNERGPLNIKIYKDMEYFMTFNDYPLLLIETQHAGTPYLSVDDYL